MRAGAALLTLLVLGGGCGTTRIYTNDPKARIFVDGEAVGIGKGKIRRRGFSHTAHIVVKAPDGRKATEQVEREFTLLTFAAGMFTYFVGWATLWEYPESVEVMLPEATIDSRPKSSWDEVTSPWMQPLTIAPASQPAAMTPSAQ